MIRALLCMLGTSVGAFTVMHCADHEYRLLSFGGILVVSITCYVYGLTYTGKKEF